MICIAGAEIYHKRVHYLEYSLSEYEHILRTEEDCAEATKLVIRTVRQQLPAEPECAEATVEDIAQIFVVEVLGLRAAFSHGLSALPHLLGD